MMKKLLSMQLYSAYAEVYKAHREESNTQSASLKRAPDLYEFIATNNLLKADCRVSNEATPQVEAIAEQETETPESVVRAAPSRKWSMVKVAGLSLIGLAAFAAAGWVYTHQAAALDALKSTLTKGTEMSKNIFEKAKPLFFQAVENGRHFIAQHFTVENMKSIFAKGMDIGKRFFEQHAPKLEDIQSLLAKASEKGRLFMAQYIPTDSLKNAIVHSTEEVHHFVKREV
jgi:hypothetical protein